MDQLQEPRQNSAEQSLELAPRIVLGGSIDPHLVITPQEATRTMRALGISEHLIADSALLIDPKNRFVNNGTHYSNRVGRLRFRSVPELQDVQGDIVRISTKVRGKDRTIEQLNRTATHEWEHVSQAERRDKKVRAGHLAIYGLAAMGALTGRRLGKDRNSKLGAALGAFLGYEAGYRIAPHERQARLRAGQVRGRKPEVTSRAFSRS